MKKQLPNYLTYLRIVLIPVLVFVYYFLPPPWSFWIAAGIFVLAGVTDWLDGLLARKWNVMSSVGRFLDPIADKLIVATCLLILVDTDRAHVAPSILILCREILVSGLREFLAELRVNVPVTNLAKYKVAAQMLAILLLLLAPGLPIAAEILDIGNFLLWVAALFTLVTGYAYFKTGAKHLAGDLNGE